MQNAETLECAPTLPEDFTNILCPLAAGWISSCWRLNHSESTQSRGSGVFVHLRQHNTYGLYCAEPPIQQPAALT
ncbi:hypothetical protein Y032_0362g3496 [Ancylostoma ceylanicum]|uniref:Uncharacterized protein n=1 Tax=Ancylostoma ceylanicum TaxID=53326 RepID=A0A016RVE3_9BILA|nr:hypothetical protein Y032_0362g3496 [Ancylostoma ceylanicum]